LSDVGVCPKSLANQLRLKGFQETEVNGRDIKSVGRMNHNFPAVVSQPVTPEHKP